MEIIVQKEKFSWAALWLLLFFFAPFCNGFNDKMPLILCTLGFSLWFLWYSGKVLRWDGESLCLGLIVLWTGCGFFYGTNFYEILFSVVAWLLLFLFYTGARSFFLEHTVERGNGFALVLFIMGLFLAILNFYNYFSRWFAVAGYRFQSGIEYSNTLALFLCIGLFAGCYLLSKVKKRWQVALCCCGNLILVAAFLFTYSRMMWVIGSFFLFAFLFFLSRKKLTIKRVGLFLAAFCGGLLLLFFLDTLFSFGFIQRLSSISLSSTELNERFAYYSDSLRILKENPLGGLGSGGWYSCLFQYQSGVYITRYPHSILAQSAVDGGIILLCLVLFVLIYPLIKSVQCAFRSDLGGMCFLLNLMILCHGLLDFDFQFPAVFMVFLANQCILLALAKQKGRIFKKTTTKAFRVCLGIMLPLLLYVSVVEGIFTLGNAAYEKGDDATAIAWFSKGDALAAYHSKMSFTYAKAMERRDFLAAREQIEAKVDAAIKTDAGNPKYYRFLGDYYRDIGAYEKSADAYDTLVTTQPMLLKNYHFYEDALLVLRQEAVSTGERTLVAACDVRLAAIPDRISAAEENYSFWTFRLNHQPELEEYTPK